MRLAGLPVYVVHSPALAERRARLEPELAAAGIAAEWITHPDPPDLTDELRRRWYRPARWRWRLRARVTGRAAFRVLTPQETALAIKHVLAYERIGGGEAEWGLVLEDDVVLEDGFAERFERWFLELPGDAEAVFIGACCGLRVRDADPERHFYPKTAPASRCADAYLLRRGAAARLRRHIVPFTLPIDWELSYQFKRRGVRVYWLEPPLVAQGSEIGLHESSLGR